MRPGSWETELRLSARVMPFDWNSFGRRSPQSVPAPNGRREGEAFRRKTRSGTSRTGVYHTKMRQWGRVGRMGQNILTLQINELEGGWRRARMRPRALS